MTDLDAQLDQGSVVPELRRRGRPGVSRQPATRPANRRPGQRPPRTPANFYPDVAGFVGGFLAPCYAHEWTSYGGGGDWRWCSQWWLHVEAVVRLEALWRAWETLRLDPGTGASVWLLHHADPAMAALTAAAGPFARCKPGEHRNPDPLVLVESPAGMFSTGRMDDSR